MALLYRYRRWRWVGIAGVGLIAVLESVGLLLAWPSDAPIKTELLVVLGGGMGERAVTGADLYLKGNAPNILLTGIPPETLSLPDTPDPFYRVAYLRYRGIPTNGMLIDTAAQSTMEEALLIRSVMLSHGWTTVMIVTDPPHLLRLSWCMRRVASHVGLRWRLIAAESSWWDALSWWGNERSARYVLMELLKLAYYAWTYG